MQLESILPTVVVGLTAVCTGLITAGSTLVATVLVIRHQYQAQTRERKRERASERLDEVRRYLAVCLELADKVCSAWSAGTGFVAHAGLEAWGEELLSFSKKADGGPVGGSQAVLFVEDDALEQLLEDFRGLARRMAVRVVLVEREVRGAKERGGDLERLDELISVARGDRGKMKKLARRVQARCEELIDET